MNDPSVSVIIPTYNSSKSLDVCLSSVRGQSEKDIEIILVDRLSNDGTKEVAEKFGAQLVQRDCERAEAKNIGLEMARGRYLLFIDADMELTRDVVKECLESVRGPNVGGVIIPERSVGAGMWVKVRDYERSFYAGTEVESARFFPRELVKRTHGFQTGLVVFEEATLPQRIKQMGYAIDKRTEAVILHHEDDFSITRWLKKKAYYGRTAKVYKKQFAEYGQAQMSFVGRFVMFFRNKRFFQKPLLAAGVIFLKMMEYGAAGIGYASVAKDE